MDSDHNTGLVLAIGSTHVGTSNSLRSSDPDLKKKLVLKFDDILPSLSLGPSVQESEIPVQKTRAESADELHQNQASSASAVSSFSNSCSFKRALLDKEAEETEVNLERVSAKVCDEDEDASPRKKLKLTKNQSAILEDSFKEHASLTPKQKQNLARQLNLRPRQVEVWFQNRRARTKLKQTETDCELLKKYCEKLKEENVKLQKEVQELKSVKLMTAPFCMQLKAATLTVCPSCERSICDGSIAPKPHFLKYPLKFNHPSAAC